jgi:hypothetical protein
VFRIRVADVKSGASAWSTIGACPRAAAPPKGGPGTEIIISAPFGRSAVHPMHLDLTEDTKQQIERLRTELPPG